MLQIFLAVFLSLLLVVVFVEKAGVSCRNILIFSQNKRVHEQNLQKLQLCVEVAATAFQRQRGLMFRLSLPEKEGMLFLFSAEQEKAQIQTTSKITKKHLKTQPKTQPKTTQKQPQEQIIKMWMKNTFIPLDMIFFDAKGRIVSIFTNAKPFSLKQISSQFKSIGVLELSAGSAKKFNISVGDYISYNK